MKKDYENIKILFENEIDDGYNPSDEELWSLCYDAYNQNKENNDKLIKSLSKKINMKYITIFVTNKEVSSWQNTIKNKLNHLDIDILEINNNYMICHFNDQKEDFKIKYSVIKFNEKLIINLQKNLKISYTLISKITSDESYGNFNEPDIYSLITSYANKCNYEEPDSIFEFVANLFYRYLSGHKLNNGNKKLSYLFMINILWFFGYEFNWINKNYNDLENEIILWVQRSYNMNNNKLKFYLMI